MTERVCDMCGKPIGKTGYCVLGIDNYCDYYIFENILELIRGNRRYDLCFKCSDELVKLLKERCKKRFESTEETD